MSSQIVAIDLGTTKVVTIVGEKISSGDFRILAFEERPSKGIWCGEVENILSVQNTVQEILISIRKKLKIEITEVFVGIAGQHIKYTDTSAVIQRLDEKSEITKEELLTLKDSVNRNMLLPDPGDKILHVLPRSYSIDNKNDINNPVGRLGNKLTGHYDLVTGKQSSIRTTELCITNLNLSLKKMILEPIASAIAALDAKEMEAGVAMIDMGGGTTDLVVIEKNKVRHVAVIPIAGNFITSVIQKGLVKSIELFEITKDLEKSIKQTETSTVDDFITSVIHKDLEISREDADVILKGLGISGEDAEQLKVRYGSCIASKADKKTAISINKVGGGGSTLVSLKTLASIIDVCMYLIMIRIKAELSTYSDKLERVGIVFTGGGAMMQRLEEYARLKTGYKVKICKPKPILSNLKEKTINPKHSTAVGLLMFATGAAKNFELMDDIDSIRKKSELQTIIKQPEVKNEDKTKTDSTDDTNSGFVTLKTLIDSVIESLKGFFSYQAKHEIV